MQLCRFRGLTRLVYFYPLCFVFFLYLFLIFSFFMLATSFECADWELRDLSSAFVPRRSGKLLPSGGKKSPCLTLIYAIRIAMKLFLTDLLSLYRRKAPPHSTWQPRRGKSYKRSCWSCTAQIPERLTLMGARRWTTLGIVKLMCKD